MERLYRWREPIAVVLLVALTLRLALGVVAAFLAAAGGADPFAGALNSGSGPGDPVLVAVAALAVVWCTRPERTPRVEALLLVAVVVIGIGALFSLVAAVASIPPSAAGIVAFLAGLVVLVVPVLAVVVLIALLRLVAVNRTQEAAVETGPPEPPALPAVAPERQPVWQADEAAGAAWLRAGDAASGAPASGWGDSRSEVGWQPIPRQDGWTTPGRPGPEDH